MTVQEFLGYCNQSSADYYPYGVTGGYKELEFTNAYAVYSSGGGYAGGENNFFAPGASGDVEGLKKKGTGADKIGAGLALANSYVTLGSIVLPALRGVSFGLTIASVAYAGYRYETGEISRDELASQVALAVEMQLLGKVGKSLGSAADAAVKVFKHEYGLLRGSKKLLVDPYR